MRLITPCVVGAALVVLGMACEARAQAIEPRCAVEGSAIACEGWDIASCPDGRFEVVSGESMVSVAVRAGRACAVAGSGAVFCWDREDVGDGCRAAPREIDALRGRAVEVHLFARATVALLRDGTVATWSEVRVRARAPRASLDVQLLAAPEGVLREVHSLEAGWTSLCFIAGPSEVWCVDPDRASAPATRLVLDHPMASLQCQDGCCALGPDGQATCWGAGASSIEGMLDEIPGRIDYLWNAAGACVATDRRVECDGWMRPEVRPGVYWGGFELRGDERAIDLRLSAAGEVCLETTTQLRCWGEARPRLRGVRPIVSPSGRRLRAGERILRARVSALTCNEEDSFDARPEITAHATGGRVRFDIAGLVSNCGYDPTIDVTLRSDGTITLAPGDPPPGAPLARCECSFDLRVMVTGVPAGIHPVLFFAEDDAPITSEVVAR